MGCVAEVSSWAANRFSSEESKTANRDFGAVSGGWVPGAGGAPFPDGGPRVCWRGSARTFGDGQLGFHHSERIKLGS